jgi:hypothetical protein
MEYKFFCKEIGELKNETLMLLKEYALSAEFKKNTGFFHKELIKTTGINLNLPIIEIVKNELHPILNSALLKKAHINMLPPTMLMPDHSDVGPKSINTDDLTIHKIHIPIVTNQHCCHFWNVDQLSGNVYATHMEEGKVYMFNNIAPHGAVNASKSDSRYHLIMRYDVEAINVY